MQQYDESSWGAYCLYMIYLIDKGFRIKGALNNLNNQVNCPGMYDECLCLGCRFKGEVKVEVDDKVEVDVNDNGNQGTCLEDQGQSAFADVNVNDNVNTNDNLNDKDNDNDNDNDNVNVNVNVNDNDNYEIVYHRGIYTNGETWVKPNPQSGFTIISIGEPRLQIYVHDSLQSCLDDDNIIVNASFPESLRCVISGHSECGKAFLLNNLIISSMNFEKLYIIGPTGNQYDDLKYEDVVFIKEIKELPPPDKLPENIKKLMIFDDVVGVDIIIVI